MVDPLTLCQLDHVEASADVRVSYVMVDVPGVVFVEVSELKELTYVKSIVPDDHVPEL
jgi:hypothetical protein